MWVNAQRDGRPALFERRKVWLTPTTRVPCSNAANTRNLLKCAGVPETGEPISAAEVQRIVRTVGEVLLFNRSFPIVDTCLNCKDTAPQICVIVPICRIFGQFLHPVFSASRAQHVSDLHPKFPLRPHHVWKYGRR